MTIAIADHDALERIENDVSDPQPVIGRQTRDALARTIIHGDGKIRH
jgi:hypothetical protein